MRSSISPLALAAALTLAFAASSGHAQQPGEATEATKAANAAVREALPFEDRQAFEDAQRGFIAPLPVEPITGADGRPIWDPGKFAFLRDAEAPDTVNPSLWRQAQLVEISGLFEVTPGIYQVRNYDLSNMTIIEGDKTKLGELFSYLDGFDFWFNIVTPNSVATN